MEFIVMGVLAPVGVATLGWSAKRVYEIWQTPEQVAEVKDDVKYIRGRLDSLYDALITR
jgi:hypothetical protein